MWNSRLWSKTGPEQTYGPLRAFVARASAPGNREVVKFRASKGSLGVKIMPFLYGWPANELLYLDLGFFLVKMTT